MRLCRKNEAAKWQSFTMYREGYEGRGRTADEERPLQEENSLKSTCMSPSGAKGMGGGRWERGGKEIALEARESRSHKR